MGPYTAAMSEDWVAVRTFLNHIEADLATSVLEAAGIESTIRADDCGGIRPHLWMGGVQVLVAPDQVPLAEEVLSTMAVDAVGEDPAD